MLFNRLMEPDIDPLQMKVTETLELSDGAELRLPLLWIGLLAGRTKASLALSTGIQTWEDVAKSVLAGADAVMTTSALLRNGISHISILIGCLRRWIEDREVGSLNEIRGKCSWDLSSDRSVYTRANYLRIIQQHAAFPEDQLPWLHRD